MKKFQNFLEKLGLGNKKRLQRIYARISAIPEGQELIAAIQDLEVNIGFRYGKRFGTDGVFTPETGKIRINRFASDDKIIRILAHEVRHAWQYRIMNYRQGDRLADFETNRIWTRMIEGDATSFENVFMEKLCLHEKKPMPQNTILYKNVYEQVNGCKFATAEDFLEKVPVEQRRNDYFRMTQVAFGRFYDENEYRQYSFDRMMRPSGYLSSQFSQAMHMDGMRKIFCVDMRTKTNNYMSSCTDTEIHSLVQPAIRAS